VWCAPAGRVTTKDAEGENSVEKKEWVDREHYRVTSDDGSRSYLYKAGGFFGPDVCVEIAEHHSNGTTDAYEVDSSVTGQLFYGGKGKHK
jgi:hypothetical protein